MAELGDKMRTIKLALIPLVMGAVFALPLTSVFASGGVITPAPLMATVAGTHWAGTHLYNAPSISLYGTMAASSTSDIVSQLNSVTNEVQNGIGILVAAAAAGLGVILGSVLAITWLPRLVRRFFPRAG